MSATNPAAETLALLRSIDSSLKQIARALVKAAPAEIADDADLDSQYGDPVLKFKPKDWTGDDYKGCHFSECPPDLLDQVASSLDYFAKKAEEAGETTSAGKPVAPYKRKDAARARGWAKRNRLQGPRRPELAPEGDGNGSWPGDGFGGDDAWT